MAYENELFQERVVRVERPSKHFTLLRAPNGEFLGASDDNELAICDYVDDKTIWDSVEGRTAYRHVVTNLVLEAEAADSTEGCYLRHKSVRLAGNGAAAADEGAIFSPGHGPAHLPSEYLKFLKENGWVCLPAILSPDTVEALERISCTGRWDSETYDRSTGTLVKGVAVAQAATEPVSLWLMRQYMRTSEIRFGHPPGFAILTPDDGERDVQGWHSDFPYHWGIFATRGTGPEIPPHNFPELVMGVQRNLCVSEFRKENGATCFKLGSHVLGEGPPDEWGPGHIYRQQGYRAAHGLPYNGPDADVVEAPGGSYILYDSRIWHRAGVNRTERKRAAMLQAVIPVYIVPKTDTSRAYRNFINSPLVDALTPLELQELKALMITKIESAGQKHVVTIDETLSEMVG
ncbi:MAG: phytanoyl-CoA dioxygenase family protein [Candidatus Poribacteria bacterium]|nr:phytanoyl-CoA dioxygenase family protein [Candidatus Poribacteria bacterium]